MSIVKLFLHLFDFVGFFLDQLVFGVQFGLILQTLLFKELDPAVLLEQFLFDGGHLLVEFLVLLVHDRVGALSMLTLSCVGAAWGHTAPLHLKILLSDLDQLQLAFERFSDL